MKSRTLQMARTRVQAGACGALVWHMVDWHAAGVCAEVLRWNERGMGCLAGLYDLVLMLVPGAVLPFLPECISKLMTSGVRTARVCDHDSERDETCSR